MTHNKGHDQYGDIKIRKKKMPCLNEGIELITQNSPLGKYEHKTQKPSQLEQYNV